MSFENKKSKQLTLWYDEPAKSKTDGIGSSEPDYPWAVWSLPLGNGYMGVNIFGYTDTERIQLTEASKYIRFGLTSFAELYLDFGHSFENDVEKGSYKRWLNIDDAVAGVEYRVGEVTYKREIFSNYPDKVTVIKLSSDKQGALNFKMGAIVPYTKSTEYEVNTGKVQALDNEKSIVISGSASLYNVNFGGVFSIACADKNAVIKAVNDNIGLGIDMSIAGRGEKDNAVYTPLESCGYFTVENATELEIRIAIGTNYEQTAKTVSLTHKGGKASSAQVNDRLKGYISALGGFTYNELKERHLKDYHSYFNRVSLDLGVEFPSTYTTDKIVGAYMDYKQKDIESKVYKQTHTYLEILYYQYGRYLYIASSREGCLPAGLQGIWCGVEAAAWTGAYWSNINVQMNNWGAFVNNLGDLFKSYADYVLCTLDSLSEKADSFISEQDFPNKAEKGIGENGWSLGTDCNPYRVNGYVLGTHSGVGNAGMTAYLFWNWYLYTGDKELLKNTVYPVIEGYAKFFTKIVTLRNGKYYYLTSASPENGGYNFKSVFLEGFNQHTGECITGYDQQSFEAVGSAVLKAAEILGYTEKSHPIIATLKEQVGKYDPVVLGASGQVKEFYDEEYYADFGEPTHRHISHLMGLYPYDIITMDTPVWLEAAKVTLNGRGDSENFYTGWGIAHRMALRSRTGDANRVYRLYQALLGNRTYYNLWDTHEPFQIDGNLGSTAAIAECFVQSGLNGTVYLLPALPSEWKSGEVRGLVAKGNKVVSAKWENGIATEFTVTVNNTGPVKLSYKNLQNAKITDSNGECVNFTSTDCNTVSFDSVKGETYILDVRC